MHFTRMGGYADQDVPIIVRGDGCYLEDANGKRYLDALAGPVLRQHRLLVRRGDRPGGARADARAALLHELVVRPSPRDRARRRGRVARPGRPQPRLLRLGRLRGRRVGLEARPPVLRGARREAAPRHVARARAGPRRDRRSVAGLSGATRRSRATSRTTARRSARSRSTASPRSGRRSSRSLRGAARAQHEPLPPSRRGDRGGVHGAPARRPRADDPRDGPRDGVHGAHGAGAERRRRVHAARRLLAGRPRALRRVRHPPLRGRGDHRVRAARPLVRLGALRHPARHRHLREGALLVVRGDRRRDRDRPGDGAVPRVARRSSRTGSRSAGTRRCARSRSRTSRS